MLTRYFENKVTKKENIRVISSTDEYSIRHHREYTLEVIGNIRDNSDLTNESVYLRVTSFDRDDRLRLTHGTVCVPIVANSTDVDVIYQKAVREADPSYFKKYPHAKFY